MSRRGFLKSLSRIIRTYAQVLEHHRTHPHIRKRRVIALKAVYPVAGMAWFASHKVDAEWTSSGLRQEPGRKVSTRG